MAGPYWMTSTCGWCQLRSSLLGWTLFTVHWKVGYEEKKVRRVNFSGSDMVLASWDHNNWPSNLELKETILNHNFHRKALARRIRRREKPFLALKGYHGNFLGKNTFSYVYIYMGKSWKIWKKSHTSQCPGFLQLPILAIRFSPNWVNLEPTYSFCLAHKCLNSNGPKPKFLNYKWTSIWSPIE